MYPNKKVLAIAGAAAGLIVAAVSPAVAAPLPTGPTLLYAVVNTNGAIARATAGTTASHPSVGNYTVRFSHSVRGCQPVANLGYPGASEVFTFQGVTTVALLSDNHTVQVTMTYPGDTTAGLYPHKPVLRDNSFHLGVNCQKEFGTSVSSGGATTTSASATRVGTGHYIVNFGVNLSGCAPTATVRNVSEGGQSALQAHLAQGPDANSVTVQISDSNKAPVDAAFYIVDFCASAHRIFSSSSGFFNSTTLPNTNMCALVGSWFQTTSSTPIAEGYVATWATSATTAGIQTKNGGYGIESGFGVTLDAFCS